MSGNLNMGSNNITSVGTVDGVTVSSHASRHKFGGADEVGTTTPTANAIPFADVSGKLDSWITPITISGGTGIVTGGTYPNFTITNSEPDQIVTISGGTGIVTGGTYPNFTISTNNGSGTVNKVAKWTGGTSLGDSLITDDGSVVTIPDVIVNSSFEFINSQYYNKIGAYYNLVRFDGDSLVKPLSNEGFGGSIDLNSGASFLTIPNDSDSRTIEILYSLRSTNDDNFRSGKIIANWDSSYTNFYQTEYGPNYDLTTMTFIDPPRVIYGGSGTVIRVTIDFDVVTDPTNLLTARFKYTLI